MSTIRKVLFVFEQPAALREMIHAATGAAIELLPVRGRQNAMAALQGVSDARAIIVEDSGQSDIAAVEILENACSLRAGLRRVILMNSPDLTSIINGLHNGSIDAILYRPVDAKQFFTAVNEPGAVFNPAQSSPQSASAARRR